MQEALQERKTTNRVILLDYLRGIGILFVMWYHLTFDLYSWFGICDFIYSDGMNVFRDCMVAMLVLISGICCHFSRNNLKRGAVCFAIAMGLTGVTALLGNEMCIKFGVLHMFGISMMVYGLLAPLLKSRHGWIWGILLIGGFLFTFSLSLGSLGIYRLPLISVPDGLYQIPFLFWLGLPGKTFISADYYPLLPWTLLFFAGSFFGNYIKYIPKCDKMPELKVLSFIGRHTLALYLLHQPIFYGILFLIAQMF